MALLASILCTSYLFIFFRYLSKASVSTFQVIVYNYYACVVCGMVFEPAFIQHVHSQYQEMWYILALLTGFGFILNFTLTATATQKIGITVASVSSKMSFIIPAILGFFVLGLVDHISWIHALGMFLAVLSVACITMPNKAKTGNVSESIKEKAPFSIYTLLPIAIFLFTGLLDTTLNFTSFHYLREEYKASYVTLIFLGAALTGTVMLFGQVLKGKEKVSFRSFVAGCLLGFPNYFSIYFLIKALSDFNNNGALMYPVYNLSIILINTLAGIVLFKEKLGAYNILGVVLSVIALVFILL